MAIYKCKTRLAVERAQRMFVSQNGMSQRMAGKQQFFKFVGNQFRRIVFDGANLVQNHQSFFFYLLFGELRMKNHVGHQFYGAFEIGFRKNRIDEGFFFGCICVDFAARNFHSVQDMPRPTLLGTFE